MERFRLVNNSLCFWFTVLLLLVLRYIKTTKRSKMCETSSGMKITGREMSVKARVTSGYASQVSQTVFLPLPLKDDTVSQPVKAWNPGSAADLMGPSCSAIRCAVTNECLAHRHVKSAFSQIYLLNFFIIIRWFSRSYAKKAKWWVWWTHCINFNSTENEGKWLKLLVYSCVVFEYFSTDQRHSWQSYTDK